MVLAWDSEVCDRILVKVRLDDHLGEGDPNRLSRTRPLGVEAHPDIAKVGDEVQEGWMGAHAPWNVLYMHEGRATGIPLPERFDASLEGGDDDR
jgi:hypothetical protein